MIALLKIISVNSDRINNPFTQGDRHILASIYETCDQCDRLKQRRYLAKK